MRLVCFIRGHRPVLVKVVDPYVVVPGSGIFTTYVEADDGPHLACGRCRGLLGPTARRGR